MAALIQRGTDAGERREVDDRGITGGLDDVGDHEDSTEQLRSLEKIDRCAAEFYDHLVDDAAEVRRGGILQKDLNETRKDDPGEEVWQVDRRLDNALDAL